MKIWKNLKPDSKINKTRIRGAINDLNCQSNLWEGRHVLFTDTFPLRTTQLILINYHIKNYAKNKIVF